MRNWERGCNSFSSIFNSVITRVHRSLLVPKSKKVQTLTVLSFMSDAGATVRRADPARHAVPMPGDARSPALSIAWRMESRPNDGDRTRAKSTSSLAARWIFERRAHYAGGGPDDINDDGA